MSNENIPVKRPGAKTIPLNAGISAVVVTDVIDQGVQPNRFQPDRPRHQVLVRFSAADGKSAARFYSPSLHDKSNLTKDLKAVNNGVVPKEFAALRLPFPQGLMGMQAQVLATRGVNAKGYDEATITAVLPPSAGQNVVVVAAPAVPSNGLANPVELPPARSTATAAAPVSVDDIPF